MPANPWGSNASGGEPQQVRLVIKPDRLIPLGDDRFALIVLEADEELGSHAEPGALSIAYVKRTRNGWAVEHVWRELAWTGAFGRPARSHLVATFAGRRLVFFEEEDVTGGDYSTTDFVVRLGSNHPTYEGLFPKGGSRGQTACSVCAHYRYTSYIHPPRRHSHLFAVSYRGWTSREAKVQRSYRFSAHTEYRSSLHGLVASPPVKLPG
jgi:hypothetical protein